MKAALGIFLAIMAGGGANAGPDGKEVPRVAFLGFEFIDTSLEATARACGHVCTWRKPSARECRLNCLRQGATCHTEPWMPGGSAMRNDPPTGG